MKPVFTVDLSPRENVHLEDSPATDVLDVIEFAVMCGLWIVVVMLAMSL